MCVPDLHSGDALGHVLSPPGTEIKPAVFHNISHTAALMKLLRDFVLFMHVGVFLEAKLLQLTDCYHVECMHFII